MVGQRWEAGGEPVRRLGTARVGHGDGGGEKGAAAWTLWSPNFLSHFSFQLQSKPGPLKD